MKTDLRDGGETGAPKPTVVEQVIEDLVYEHLIDLVDFDRMYELEQIVELRLAELVELGELAELDQLGFPDRAASILARAWHRLIDDPRRYVDFKGRWEADDQCELCRALADRQVRSDEPDRSKSS